MTLKKNSLQILLALYSKSVGVVVSFTQEQLELLVTDLSTSGMRSLLYRLRQLGCISTLDLESGVHYYLTQKGAEALIRRIPALRLRDHEWSGVWHQIVFLNAPTVDPAFRNIRNFLQSRNAILITRGVYLIPDFISEDLQQQFKLNDAHSEYGGSVFLTVVGGWGNDVTIRTLITLNGLEDLHVTYSSISKDIDDLLSIISVKQRLTDRSKLEIAMVFARFWEVLGEDGGVSGSLQMHSITPHSLLQRVQNLVLHASSSGKPNLYY